MKITLAEIFRFGDCTVTSRNFVEGEKVLASKHILKCGKVNTNSVNSISLLAYCLQTSDLKGKPHELKGEIGRNGQVLGFQCSCKAGLSQKCEHILAVLLNCYNHDIDEFDDLSCTDAKCVWREPQKKTLEQYKATRVKDHECYSKSYKGCKTISLSEDQIKLIKQLSLSTGENAYTKHIIGRHEILVINNNEIDDTLEVVEAIVNNEESSVMRIISQVKVPEMNDCCHARISNFYTEDLVTACINSDHSLSDWIKLRQFRITGSRIYKIFTYSANKNPNWQKKSLEYFYPKTFRSKYTDHDKKYEKVAIAEYEKLTQTTVTTCGLVIPKSNAWMGYSPDGLVMKDGKPYILIEVKCPYTGKSSTISDIIKDIKYLQINDDNTATFKERHEYYCQVQMGMSVLNVKSTDFIIYASFDSTFFILNVPLNEKYIVNILTTVKETYCTQMLHYICMNESENVPDNKNT